MIFVWFYRTRDDRVRKLISLATHMIKSKRENRGIARGPKGKGCITLIQLTCPAVLSCSMHHPLNILENCGRNDLCVDDWDDPDVSRLISIWPRESVWDTMITIPGWKSLPRTTTSIPTSRAFSKNQNVQHTLSRNWACGHACPDSAHSISPSSVLEYFWTLYK
jgi:hypothetical protein